MKIYIVIIRIMEVLFIAACFYMATNTERTNIYPILAPASLLFLLHLSIIIYTKENNAADIALLTMLALSAAGCIIIMTDDIKSDNNAAWQSQIEYALDVSKAKEHNEIRLVDYKETGVINTQEEKDSIMQKMFAPQSHICYANNILTIEAASKDSTLSRVVHSAIEGVKKIIKVNMKTIELKWMCNGNSFYTTALIDKESGTIIYDNIGSFATGARFQYQSDRYPD